MPATEYYSRSLTELVTKRVAAQSDSPALYTSAPTDDPSKLLQSLTYSQLQKAIDRLAWHYSTVPGLLPEAAPGSIPPVRIVAVLTSSAIDESLLEIALAKLGLTALLLSVNNSTQAVAHLIKITKASHLAYGTNFIQEARDAQEILRKEEIEVGLVADQRFPLWGAGGVEETSVKSYPARLTPEQEKDRPAVVLHSSGSTGFPKPVYITHYGLIANAALNQNKNGFSTLPVFHGYGHFSIFRCLYSGKPISLYPTHLPLTSANICKVIKASPPIQQCFAVPYVIKLLGETEEGIKALANFDVIGYAGAAVPDDLGDRLTAAGVNLLSIYGTTETGSLMNSNRDFSSDKDWNWLRPLSPEYIIFEPRGGDTFELIVKDGYPPKVETNRPDGSYATKDLFMQHKIHSDRYKYIGRLDDTLVQTLGEKTNPVPIELAIRGNSPYVAEAIVFGAGRPQTGVLLLPSELGKDLSQGELMTKIWPVIEHANEAAPTHSRILPEMVAFLPYGTHIPIATKMSILRPACYAKFKDLIDSIYDHFEQGTNHQKLTLSLPKLEEYVQEVIIKAVGSTKGAKLTKNVDLFAFGVDSLQGARIRNTIVKTVEMNGGLLGQNVVYEYPSVIQLTKHIYDVQNGALGEKTAEQQYEVMYSMVDRYASQLVARQPSFAASTPESHVVVLTGASGSLGAHILVQLAASSQVRKVICLTRAKCHRDSLNRVKESLKLRKLALKGENKLVSYASNANDNLLGLTQAEYDEIRDEATIVIHNAWPVNFVLSIESYDEHIRGALNLMNLCLSSPHLKPAEFVFSSSISCRQGSLAASCDEEYSADPATAAGTGYARSKWVVEKLCQRAAERTDLGVRVLRIGQMVGDTLNGIWNETEAWPLMFKGANTVGFLPKSDQGVSWLPVDYAGRAIAEVVLLSNPPKSIVYHIVNPQMTAWRDIITGLNEAGLRFEAVEQLEYVKKLENSERDPEKNPIIKLLPFFRNKYYSGDNKPMLFLTDETARVAPSIAQSPKISKDLVQKWVEHWRQVSFLD